jgi:hypothetical protein
MWLSLWFRSNLTKFWESTTTNTFGNATHTHHGQMVSFVRLSSDWALRVERESVRKVDDCGWFALGKLIFLSGSVCVCAGSEQLFHNPKRAVLKLQRGRLHSLSSRWDCNKEPLESRRISDGVGFGRSGFILAMVPPIQRGLCKGLFKNLQCPRSLENWRDCVVG